MRSNLRGTAVLVAVLLAMSLAACDKAETDAKKNATASCDKSLQATPTKPIPDDLPGATDRFVYYYTTQGKTEIWYATTAGTRDTIVAARDSIAETLKAAGYTITKKDQEPGVEAEAYFTGPHGGSMQVQVACQGKLKVRWKVES